LPDPMTGSKGRICIDGAAIFSTREEIFERRRTRGIGKHLNNPRPNDAVRDVNPIVIVISPLRECHCRGDREGYEQRDQPPKDRERGGNLRPHPLDRLDSAHCRAFAATRHSSRLKKLSITFLMPTGWRFRSLDRHSPDFTVGEHHCLAFRDP